MYDFNRLLKISKEYHFSTADLCVMCGKQRGWINDMRRVGRTPPDEAFEIWAEAMRVSPAYLRGETDEKTPPAEPGAEKIIYAMLNDMSAKELLELSEYIVKLAREKMEK